MNETPSKKSPGRPAVLVSWPDGEFTIKTLAQTNKVSKVTLCNKIKEALNQNIITVRGKERRGKGRPCIVYRKAAQPTPVPDATPVVSDKPQTLLEVIAEG